MLIERIRRYLLSFGAGKQFEMWEFTEVRPWWMFWKEPRRRYEGRATMVLHGGIEAPIRFTIDGARTFDEASRRFMAELQTSIPAARQDLERRMAKACLTSLPALHTAGTFYPEAPG